jgi:type 1 glutamine amidotransferase
LAKADLAVFYLRWRRLPEDQLRPIEAYIKSGKPIIGFRTSSHAFNYPKGDPREHWNRWATDVFGAPPGWGGDGHTHFGHDASTDVRIAPDAARHPILRGVAPSFHVRSWLYRVLPKWPPPTAEQLLIGTAVNPNKPAEPNPVAWTWKNTYGARVFFTTMGHPEDFAVESVQRLTVNAIHWSLQLRGKWKGPIAINVPYRGMVKGKG